MKKKKKKEKRDFSMLIYALVFICIASFLVFTMLTTGNGNQSAENKEKQNTVQQQKVVEKPVPNKISKPTIADNLPAFGSYNYKYTYEIEIEGSVKDFFFQIPIPSNESEKQYLFNVKNSVKPTKTYYDGTTTYAEYSFPQISAQKMNIVLEGTAKVRTYDLRTAKLINKNISPEKDLSRYLQEEKYIEVNDPVIKSAVAKIKGETKEEIIQNIYEYTQKSLKYMLIPGTVGAKTALKRKFGKCSEFTAVMVALCRAKGIPARVVIGNMAKEEMTKHSWVEIYFDEYGWVTFDPTVMPTYVNVYVNGKLVKTKQQLQPDSSLVKYIISGKNIFSPYILRYGLDTKNNGKATIRENIVIEKTK